MQDVGIAPLILTQENLSQEQSELVRQRGWRAESFPVPPVESRSLKDRSIPYVRRQPAPDAPGLVERLRQLAHDAVLIEAQQIWTVQYLLRVRAATPRVASFQNVESEVYRDRIGAAGRPGAGLVGDARTDRPAHRLPISRYMFRQRSRVWRMSSVERRVARRATVTVCVSEADRGYFQSLGSVRTLLVPNGIDEPLLDIPPPSGETTDVLFFGTLEWAPNLWGIAEFIQHVWPRVAAAVPSATLRIAGPGRTDRLRRLAAQAERTEVLGFVPSLEPELRRARCVVAPIPFGGGTRIKVLEALAAGRPVVGTRVGVEQLGFEHGRHGFVADSPEEMIRHVTQLLEDAELARRLAAEGRRLASAYTWPRVLAPARELYSDWLAAWRQARTPR
jgi:glycosyltransferase involved in cell wall biosynthesis